MKERSEDDFSGIITDLIFNNSDIVTVGNRFEKKPGVYYNPKAQAGFQYAAAFATVDEDGCTWVETFSLEKIGPEFKVRGRWGSKHMGVVLNGEEIILCASEMVDLHLTPQ